MLIITVASPVGCSVWWSRRELTNHFPLSFVHSPYYPWCVVTITMMGAKHHRKNPYCWVKHIWRSTAHSVLLNAGKTVGVENSGSKPMRRPLCALRETWDSLLLGVQHLLSGQVLSWVAHGAWQLEWQTLSCIVSWLFQDLFLYPMWEIASGSLSANSMWEVYRCMAHHVPRGTPW